MDCPDFRVCNPSVIQPNVRRQATFLNRDTESVVALTPNIRLDTPWHPSRHPDHTNVPPCRRGTGIFLSTRRLPREIGNCRLGSLLHVLRSTAKSRRRWPRTLCT